MKRNKRLLNETLILTGTSINNHVIELAEQEGANVHVCPLVKIVYSTHSIPLQIERNFDKYEWIIFTSSHAVKAFHEIVRDFHITAKFAAVGKKTAETLTSLNYEVSFVPTIFSADEFVNQFPHTNGKCLFVKGNLAKDTIKTKLNTVVDEWVIYDTVPNEEAHLKMKSLLYNYKNPIVAIGSPSAAKQFNSIQYHEEVIIASIGTVTTKALQQIGLQPTIQPKTFTWESVVQEIIKWKEGTK